jgi:hypothetical protein
MSMWLWDMNPWARGKGLLVGYADDSISLLKTKGV